MSAGDRPIITRVCVGSPPEAEGLSIRAYIATQVFAAAAAQILPNDMPKHIELRRLAGDSVIAANLLLEALDQ